MMLHKQAIDEKGIRIVDIELGETKSASAQIIDGEAPYDNELIGGSNSSMIDDIEASTSVH